MDKNNKLLARNLTAKADEVVKGNPVSSRLESGVDNCYPGLEFDQRNLDKSFFPGLNFEFHHSVGAKLVDINENSMPYEQGLRKSDIEKSEIYLWCIIGRFGSSNEEEYKILGANGLNGLEVWRRIHDLNTGRVGIILGAGNGFSNTFNQEQFDAAVQSINNNSHTVKRDSNGIFQFATFADMREGYIDENGVINTLVYQPGELTKTLCSPWQYDFRDCGCFYWAANKPDIVTSADGNRTKLNFMRKERNAPDFEGSIEQWTSNEIGYDDLVNGYWNEMPVIINDRESEAFNPEQPIIDELMTKEQVIKELKYLATVEHALCVEYLYAHYSIDSPQKLEEDASAVQKNKFIAANEILRIAIDEMRHFRWVNEALNIFGEEPVVDRASIIKSFNKPFELKPLTKQKLQWFIDVEKPSQDLGQSIDGMYVKLLLSIEKQPDLFPDNERLIHLFKLIIDEGEDHYQRFLSIQEHLKDLDESQYLRSLNDPTTDDRLKALQRLADQNYEVMIGTLSIAFEYADGSNGKLLEEARRAMYNLHDTAHLLGLNGTDINFILPTEELVAMKSRTSLENFVVLEERFNKTVEEITPLVSPTEIGMVKNQKEINDSIISKMRTIIEELN